MKTCFVCHTDKALSEFHRGSKSKSGRQGRCKACAAAWYQANKEQIRAKQNAHLAANREAVNRRARERYNVKYKVRRLVKMYGIPEEEVLALLTQATCFLCGRSETRLGIDHCHATGRVRGRLCVNCNNGLGRFKDDPILLRRAADYLEASCA